MNNYPSVLNLSKKILSKTSSRLFNLACKFGFYRSMRFKLACFTANLLNYFKINKDDFSYYEYYDLWKKKGFYVIPNHFYQPIPDIDVLNDNIFKTPNELVGVDVNEKKQLYLLQKSFPEFKEEYQSFTTIPCKHQYEFRFNNLAFDNVDALVYYCMVRLLKPNLVIEVGSGWSTKVAARAALLNKKTKLISIEPYPQPFLKKGFPGFDHLVDKRVEEIPLSFFDQLEKDDILFIDSSHTVKTGGDVNRLILEVLPRLKKGVVIHIHDIFFPFEYPKEWVKDEHRAWSEQYLIQAFLAFNDSFEVKYSNSYMYYKHKKEVQKTFSNSPAFSGGSLWLRKIK